MSEGAGTTPTRAEEAMAHLAAIVNSSDDAIWSRTPQGIITSWNRGAERLFGYGAAEAVGRHISFIVPQDRQEELQRQDESVLRGGQVKNRDTVRISKDGREINISLTLSPILDKDGAMIGISGIARDNSERLRMERLLRESEARYRTLVEMAPDAVFVHQDGRFVYANCAALGIHGARSHSELQKHSFYDLLHPGDREPMTAKIRELVEGVAVASLEYRLLRLNGEELTLESSSTLINYQGRPSIQVIARDVTQRKAIEREREQMLEELAFQRTRFETVLQQMPVGVLVAEAPSGKVVYQNDLSREIFRQEPGEVKDIGDYHRCELYGMDGTPLATEHYPLVRALQQGETVIGEEYKILRGDGTSGYVSVNAIPIRDVSGEIVSGLVSFSDITQSKGALKALSESEERLTLALDAAGMGSCDMDVETGAGFWSRSHFTLLGYAAPEDASAPASVGDWQNRILAEDREEVLRALDRARSENSFFRSEHRIVRVDNEMTVWVNVMGRFICDPSGAPCRFIGVVFDVTERKAVEEALRRSEKRFRMMADSMPQIVWTAESTGSFDYFNAHFENYTGLDREKESALLRDPEKTMIRVVHPDDVAGNIEAWFNAVSSGALFQYESRIRRRDGMYRWHLSRAKAERDDEGEIVKWYGTSTDIHDLREMQEKLRANEATLKLAVETTELGIFDLDLVSGKGEWSDIAKRHYGLGPEAEVDLEVVMSGVHQEDRERMERIVGEALSSRGDAAYSADYRSIGISDGKERWLSMRARVSCDKEGAPVRLVGACLNITEAVQAQNALKEEMTERLRAVEDLRRQEQLLIRQGRFAAMGEMIGNIAHQWRQPLNTLGLIVQELPTFYERDLFSKEYLEGSVTRAMQVINYMSQTIDGFRNFFGPEKEKQTFQAGELLEKTVGILDAAFAELKLMLEVRAEPEVAVYGSPNEYSQVILNILMNAKDALLERKVAEPKVVVRLFKEGERSVLTVTDNAGGIAPEIMERIFDPYFTTKGPDKGTGIGLFMSKTIIEKNMGGTLSVRNTGDGAEFRIEV
ncbi:MAG TPA: hypothetical protein DCZ75_01210 [Geobacter sp.]|nr:hypothetical protein [Geobacter sp.]